MRNLLKRFLPGHESVRDNRWLRLFGSTLLHPRLWHLNRHSAAGAVAVGLFCGLIPGPLQMLGAAIMALALRINLPLALLVTLYTNPLTIVPLYVVAFELGEMALGKARTPFIPPPEFDWSNLAQWLAQTTSWAMGLGKPLGIGLVLLASLLAVSGYLIVRTLWRLHSLRAWQRRRQSRCR
jgi:uncharacterized protein